MRKIIFGTIMTLLMALAATSCALEVQYDQVPFEEIHGTCTLNPSKVTPGVIYSKSELDRTYINLSPAVDMSENFIIMICAPKGELNKEIRITEVMNKDASMYVKYTVKSVSGSQGTPQDAGCPHSTVAVSRAYAGCDVSFFDVSEN